MKQMVSRTVSQPVSQPVNQTVNQPGERTRPTAAVITEQANSHVLTGERRT